MADPQKKEIIETPDNWDEMVKKYQEREEEQLQKVLEKRNVSSVGELQDIAHETLSTRALRVAREHEPLKSHKILIEPKSPEIQSLRQKLNEEIRSVAKEIFQQAAKLKIPEEALKGRIKIPQASALEGVFEEAGHT